MNPSHVPASGLSPRLPLAAFSCYNGAATALDRFSSDPLGLVHRAAHTDGRKEHEDVNLTHKHGTGRSRPTTPPPRTAWVQIGERRVEMLLHGLASSLLEAAGHDGSEWMVVVFCGGGEARQRMLAYQGVPPRVFADLRQARSPGTFFSHAVWERYPACAARIE